MLGAITSQPSSTSVRATPDPPARECCGANPACSAAHAIDLMEFVPLVRSIASRIYASIPPYAAIELNDLMQSGHLGLVHAGLTYQSSRRVPFAVYARFRIRGEILDSLRQIDTASRRMRRLDRRVKATRLDLTARLRRDPTDVEVAEKLQLEMSAAGGKPWDLTLLRLPPVNLTSLDDRNAGTEDWKASEPGPDTLRSDAEARQLLQGAIDRLPVRSQQLIQFYYRGGLTMRQIGVHFRVNESRVSQIHRRALERMARYLRAAGVGSVHEV